MASGRSSPRIPLLCNLELATARQESGRRTSFGNVQATARAGSNFTVTVKAAGSLPPYPPLGRFCPQEGSLVTSYGQNRWSAKRRFHAHGAASGTGSDGSHGSATRHGNPADAQARVLPAQGYPSRILLITRPARLILAWQYKVCRDLYQRTDCQSAIH